jgi:hypothetical protein
MPTIRTGVSRRYLPGMLLAVLVLLTGCATSPAAARSSGPAVAPSRAAAARPSTSAAMICGPEIRGEVTKVLALRAAAPVRSTFVDRLYTCTYRLPFGPLVLSVRDSATHAAALAYFSGSKARLGSTTQLTGLGESSYGTTTSGVVVVLKDTKTLTVDASRLPVQFGSMKQRRTDLAYEIASVVLGCWTGDE